MVIYRVFQDHRTIVHRVMILKHRAPLFVFAISLLYSFRRVAPPLSLFLFIVPLHIIYF